MASIDNCIILDIPKISSDKGSLSVIEGRQNLPFDIKRVYYTFDIPSGAERGGHAHKELHQIIIAASGSFEVILDDGTSKKRVFLNNPGKGLLITSGIWRELKNFSTGSIVLVLASDVYKESDYYREYNHFLRDYEN